jgi:RND superfamily putative drug exporter
MMFGMRENLVGRVGRWCFRHWAWVLVAWALAVAGGIAATGPLFARLADSGVPRHVESVAGADALNAGDDSAGTVTGVIDGVDPRSDQVRTVVSDAAARLLLVPGVRTVTHPYDPGAPARAAALVAPDGRAVLVVVTFGDIDRGARDASTATITDELHGLVDALPAGVTVDVGGSAALSLQVRHAVREDLQRAEFLSLPVTLVVLVLIFGGLVAAGLPVLTAAVSVAAAMGVLLGFSMFTDVDQDGVTVVTLLGVGLSVDYGLLLVARYREELLRGDEPLVAIGRAWATAGRTIFFSALTVAAALSGLLMFDLPALTALGAAGVSIALVAMLGSLTFTAGLVGLFKRWIRPSRRERRRVAAGDEVGAADERGFFARLSRVVQRRPVLVALATAAVLIAAGAPLVSAGVKLPRLEGVPRTIESARVADALADRFGQRPAPPITVVARTDPATLDAWAARWRDDPAVTRIAPARAARTSGLASVGIEVAGEPQGPRARDLVWRLRADRPDAPQSWVTGEAATLADLIVLIQDGLPLALSITAVAKLALLFLMTGSLVVPVKAIIANVVSLGATFGVLTAVFGYGFASGLLDTLTVGALNPFVVVVVFAFAFGLSMDYEIFLLARIKEYVDAGADTDAAVRRGLQHTGRVITSAALLMVIVFACFAAARIGNIEQIGLGLATAVLIDATIVRCLLVPATMTLLGRWNWWAPRWMTRLHRRIGLSEAGSGLGIGVGAGAVWTEEEATKERPTRESPGAPLASSQRPGAAQAPTPARAERAQTS